MDRIGPYVIDRKLGTGGMGTVYLAVHEKTGRQAAVKVLPAGLARETGFRERFEREVQALQKIKNPHVVEIFDSGSIAVAGDDDGDEDLRAYYYAMEYVDGETLLSLLRREQRLPWTTVVDYGVQICIALRAAHNAGIVHRDLKPSNLLIGRNGIVKLADFGVAQIFSASRLTKSGGVIGTAEFMSPEQAQGQRATKKSDLYSLGGVLYTMLSGKPPYSGETMLDVMHKHRFGQFDRPRHFAPDCPSWLEDVVCQLLEKDPDKRPADAYVTGRRLSEIPKKVDLSRSEPLPAHAAAAIQGAGPPPGQEILSHEDESGEEVDVHGDAVTRTAPGLVGSEAEGGISRRGPGEATLMHALMRQEVERQQQRHPVQSFFENTWVLLGLLVLLLVGGYFWYHSLPTPEWHWAEAERLIEAGDYSTARIDHLQPLLNENDDWPDRAQALIDETHRLEGEQNPGRRLRRQRSVRNNGDGTDDGDGTADTVAESSHAGAAEIDRLLRRAETYRDLGDTAAAAGVLEALLTVTQDVPELTEQREEAASLLRSIHDDTDETDGRAELIRATLRRAESLAENDPAAAEEIYRGLLALYRDDPAVESLLEPARQALEE